MTDAHEQLERTGAADLLEATPEGAMPAINVALLAG